MWLLHPFHASHNSERTQHLVAVPKFPSRKRNVDFTALRNIFLGGTQLQLAVEAYQPLNNGCEDV